MAIGIERLAVYVPEKRLATDQLSKAWQLDDRLKAKVGITHVARKEPGERASDLAAKAFALLRAQFAFDPAEIELIILVTQNPDRAIPHVSARLHARLGLMPSCVAFDISHGCAGYVYGLATAIAFMREQGLKKALLFTSDPYSEVVSDDDRGTAPLFGDAASCTLLSDTPAWVAGAFSFFTDGSRGDSLTIDGGRLKMDGMDVFNFAARQVPLEIEKVLVKNRLGKDEIGKFLIHSGSRYIVDAITERAALPPARVPFGIEQVGNTVSTSIPFLFEKIFNEEKKPVLLVGFGVGLASAATVLRRP